MRTKRWAAETAQLLNTNVPSTAGIFKRIRINYEQYCPAPEGTLDLLRGIAQLAVQIGRYEYRFEYQTFRRA